MIFGFRSGVILVSCDPFTLQNILRLDQRSVTTGDWSEYSYSCMLSGYDETFIQDHSQTTTYGEQEGGVLSFIIVIHIYSISLTETQRPNY